MTYRLYYDARGKIYAYDTSPQDSPPMYADADFIVREFTPDLKRFVVDRGVLREMTAEERRTLNAPDDVAIRIARASELTSSDWHEMQEHAGWADYRQKLRDITEAGDNLAMLEAWPLRPDGSDAIAHLKADMN